MRLDYERHRRARRPDRDWIVVLVGILLFPFVFCLVLGGFVHWFGN